MEAMPEIEWNAFNTGIYTTEEADFMAQLLGNCSLPNELPGISSFGLPSSSATTFCTGRESAMNQSVIYSYSDNNTNPPNVYSFSQGSSYNYQYQYQELSDDQSDQFLAMNDSSMSIDFCTGEDRNTGSLPVEVYNDSLMEGDECLNQEMSSGSGSGSGSGSRDESGRNLQIRREPEMAVLETSAEEKNDSLLLDKKRSRVSGDVQRKRNVKSRKNQKVASANNNDEDNNNGGINRQASSSCCSEEEYSNNASQEQLNNNGGGVTSSSNSKGAAATLNLNGESRASRGSATDPQSLYARKRRERINEKLRILQHLVPNGTKVDISTMLEEAVQYVKFLQLQIKLLSSDDLWMYAPIAHNGMDIGLDLKIKTPR